MFLSSYRTGTSRKEQIQNFLQSFKEKERIYGNIIRQLMDEVGVCGEIIEDMVKVVRECECNQREGWRKKTQFMITNSKLAQAECRK